MNWIAITTQHSNNNNNINKGKNKTKQTQKMVRLDNIKIKLNWIERNVKAREADWMKERMRCHYYHPVAELLLLLLSTVHICSPYSVWERWYSLKWIQLDDLNECSRENDNGKNIVNVSDSSCLEQRGWCKKIIIVFSFRPQTINPFICQNVTFGHLSANFIETFRRVVVDINRMSKPKKERIRDLI